MKKMTIYYDAEGDYLEISSGDHGKGFFKDLGDGIFERVDEKTNEVVGIAIHCFKKRMGNCKDIALPISIQMKSTAAQT